MCLCIAFNYGGRAEIVDAMNAILAQRAGNGSNGHGATKRNGQVSVKVREHGDANHRNGDAADQHQRAHGNGHFQRITEDEVSSYLYTEGLPDPDLLIRTSGEMRVSNFLLWQIAYAEMYVSETLWPDFNRARLLEALVEFQKRDRRYGGLHQPNSSANSGEAVSRRLLPRCRQIDIGVAALSLKLWLRVPTLRVCVCVADVPKPETSPPRDKGRANHQKAEKTALPRKNVRVDHRNFAIGYFTETSRARWLAITSRISARFFADSKAASRLP